MRTLSHEMKHLYQYWSGKLILGVGKLGGINSKEIEREAHERGDRFYGTFMTKGQNFDMYYKYDNTLPNTDSYNNLNETTPSIFDDNTKQQIDYLNRNGILYLYNIPNEK